MDQLPDIPADLTGLSRDELASLEAALLERFAAIGDDRSDASLADLTRIADTLPALGERIDAIDAQAAAAADAAARVDAYRSRRTEPAPDVVPDADDVGVQARPPMPEVEPPPVDVAPVVVDAVPADPGTGLATVAAGRTSMASVAARAPVTTAPRPARPESRWYASLTAGVDIPGIGANAAFTSAAELSQAVIKKVEALSRGSAERAQAMIARAHLPEVSDVIQTGESGNNATIRMLNASQEWRKRRAERGRGALTADTGFCAPTETIWDLCEYGEADMLLDLPEVGITRGGIRFFTLPDLACFDNYSWDFGPDELECMDKPCQEIPCPELTEELPGVIGACLQAGILQARAFPELVDLYVRNTLKRHLVLISQASIARIIAGSTPVVYDATVLGNSGFTAALLAAIEFQAIDVRADYMLGMGEEVTVLIPFWSRGAIRADLAQRQGVDLLSITDAQIDALFEQRGVTVQWLKNWPNDCISTPGAQRTYPTTVQFVIYREGAWVRGLEPVIEIDTLYDSILLRRNKFVRLFTEQAILMANLCTTSRVVTVPVCPNGSTHAGAQIVCFSETCTPGTVTCPPNVECPALPCCETEPTPTPTP